MSYPARLIFKKPERIVAKGLSFLEQYFSQKGLKNFIEEVHIKQMGHAMPLPKKNHLFNDRNIQSRKDHFYFAGVDNGCLPLFLEALDSGLIASEFASTS